MISDEVIKDMNLSIEKFENDLKIPNGFYQALLKEDDWSFIIKLSALLETAATDVLTTLLGYPHLEEAVSYIDYGNTKSGKVVLMEKLDAVYKNQAQTLRQLLELRNKVAHRLENVNFKFESYISSLDDNQKEQFIKSFGHAIEDSFKIKDQKFNKKDFVLKNPKLSIWLTVREIIACIYLSKEKKNIETKLTFSIKPEE